ncbi:MAG: hypothetical protein D6814_13735 [Calditrichaeota bacterium]|nr:MAG: hypothetical protein D6814_13735 [Calditrichota bacterium]
MPFPTKNVVAPERTPGEPERGLPSIFPKEFERRLIDSIDKRFTAILLISLLLHLVVVTYMALHPPANEASQKEIAAIQKRFARFVLERPREEENANFKEISGAVAARTKAKDVGKSPEAAQKKSTRKRGGRAAGRSLSAEGRQAARAGVAAQRRRTRAQIQREVSNQGILGLLTSTSSSAGGAEVEDVLSDNTVNQNLGKALSGVGGLKRGRPGGKGSGKGSRDIRGGRATGGGGIDELVEGLEKSQASGVSRSQEMVVDASSALLAEEEGTANSGARDIDAVAAVVKSHNAAIQYCYQRELKRNPNLRGKLVVRFIINPMGRVEEVTILSSTLKNRRVERCIVNRIKRWADFGVIDPSKGNTAFRQVYTFGY